MPMERENKTQPSESRKEAKPVVQQHPELLMAAREGDSARLNDLLGNATAPEVVVDIENITVVDIEDITVTIERVATFELDSILHVVASSGDSAEFLESASVIHGKAKHLLDSGNYKGDTPLHYAARAGRINMVSHLIHLARAEGGGDARVKAVLRKQNKEGETALHEALRLADNKMVKAMVDKLMAADAELARFPQANDTSPLYLAISLGHDDIAEQLHEKGKDLSYCGPNGQNVLHAAVLRSTGMTKKLLEWNKDLSKQGDRPNGSTPLHFAASCGFHKAVKLLIDADKSLAYQSDDNGSFPIHVAVMGNKANSVRVLLGMCPDCAELRDARGRTFLHIAVNDKNDKLVGSVCSFLRGSHFASIMNMQDNEGNTGLHLAVLAGSLPTSHYLLRNKEVQLNLPNKKGQTALDLSRSKTPTGVLLTLDPRRKIHFLLRLAGAKYGTHLENDVPKLDEKEEAKKIMDSTQTVGIVSTLLVTVSFTAAFTIPGGYRADDPKGGTPVLATNYFFQAFIVANTLALFCSTLTTMSLLFAGVTTVDISTRMRAFNLSLFFLNSSYRSLAAAFVFGTNATLAPVALAIADFTWGCIILMTLLDVCWSVWKLTPWSLVLFNRLGIGACLWFAVEIVTVFTMELWPYVTIGSCLAEIH